jgi:hypothetical protein
LSGNGAFRTSVRARGSGKRLRVAEIEITVGHPANCRSWVLTCPTDAYGNRNRDCPFLEWHGSILHCPDVPAPMTLSTGLAF